MENISFYIFLLFSYGAIHDVVGRSRGHGKKSHDDGKIVGGQEVSINDYPYQVYLLVLRGGLFYACGGSIIGKHYVLTAAHCLVGAQRAYIRAGSTDSDSGGQMYSSSLLTIHPQYNPTTYDKDIAIIRTLKSISIDEVTTRIIQLPEANSTVEPGSDIDVSGWGATSEGGDTSSTLMAVTVPKISNEDCNQSYSGSITENMFCAGLEEGGKDSCQGDSGGPAVYNNIQVGIVSWGEGCARPNKPGVYADIAKLRGWINQVTKI